MGGGVSSIGFGVCFERRFGCRLDFAEGPAGVLEWHLAHTRARPAVGSSSWGLLQSGQIIVISISLPATREQPGWKDLAPHPHPCQAGKATPYARAFPGGPPAAPQAAPAASCPRRQQQPDAPTPCLFRRAAATPYVVNILAIPTCIVVCMEGEGANEPLFGARVTIRGIVRVNRTKKTKTSDPTSRRKTGGGRRPPRGFAPGGWGLMPAAPSPAGGEEWGLVSAVRIRIGSRPAPGQLRQRRRGDWTCGRPRMLAIGTVRL